MQKIKPQQPIYKSKVFAEHPLHRDKLKKLLILKTGPFWEEINHIPEGTEFYLITDKYSVGVIYKLPDGRYLVEYSKDKYNLFMEVSLKELELRKNFRILEYIGTL